MKKPIIGGGANAEGKFIEQTNEGGWLPRVAREQALLLVVFRAECKF